VPADDPALRARPLAIPFHHSLLGREDRGLEDRLCAELPAVLAWDVAGWDDHRQRGRLDPPAAVSDATSTYRINNDGVTEFIDDCCLLNPRRRAETVRHPPE
jgi:putative DNA primase/helicase